MRRARGEPRPREPPRESDLPRARLRSWCLEPAPILRIVLVARSRSPTRELRARAPAVEPCRNAFRAHVPSRRAATGELDLWAHAGLGTSSRSAGSRCNAQVIDDREVIHADPLTPCRVLLRPPHTLAPLSPLAPLRRLRIGTASARWGASSSRSTSAWARTSPTRSAATRRARASRARCSRRSSRSARRSTEPGRVARLV